VNFHYVGIRSRGGFARGRCRWQDASLIPVASMIGIKPTCTLLYVGGGSSRIKTRQVLPKSPRKLQFSHPLLMREITLLAHISHRIVVAVRG
jgi:hypothetical protein